jgi:D-alanyl-D-alanine carboxypeptidase
MDIPNRDKMIFDLLDEASTGVSAPAPAPVAGAVAELPLAGAATPTVVVSAVTAPAGAPVTPTAVAKQASPTAVAAEEPVVFEQVPNEKLSPVQVAPVRQLAVKPEAKVVETPKTEVAQPEVKAAAPVKSGGWGVQVAAVGSKAEAEKAAKTLQSKWPQLKGYKVATPDAGNGHWRVQFVGMSSRAAAAGVCSQLAGKQPCFPVTAK